MFYLSRREICEGRKKREQKEITKNFLYFFNLNTLISGTWWISDVVSGKPKLYFCSFSNSIRLPLFKTIFFILKKKKRRKKLLKIFKWFRKKKKEIFKVCVSMLFLFLMILIFPAMNPEEEWYNKSLSALRMNSSHHPNLTAPMLQYQT